jgi:ATP-dependent protease ClpP protease subunit
LWSVRIADNSATTLPRYSVHEAIAIMICLQHDAKVVITVGGFAARSAVFAVGASDELVVAQNAETMAHLSWAVMIGNAADMRNGRRSRADR